MKRTLYLLLILISNITFSQNQEGSTVYVPENRDILDMEPSELPLAIADIPPEFKNCSNVIQSQKLICFKEKLDEYINNNIKYTKEMKKLNLSGIVNVSFKIDITGKVTNVSSRGADQILNDEAENIIKKIPQLKPAIHNGRSILVNSYVKVTFKPQ